MNHIQKYAYKNKALFWDISDIESLSEVSIQERFMQYGDWKDILFLQDVLGEKFGQNYKIIRGKKRKNISKKTQYFFDKYLHV